MKLVQFALYIFADGRPVNHSADSRILECALESRAAYIVSGDKHLLELGQFEGVPILDAAAFLAGQ